MAKAVIYARYSSDNQREESIDGQLRECREYAERNNITIIANYIDRALSARTADRPEFQCMIKDSEKRLFDTVLVWKLDRFSRDRYDSAHYKRILKKNGVSVVSVKENIADTPEGIILESMLEGMAEYYSAELSVKVKRGLKENALKCQFNGGYMPYGYMIDKERRILVIDPVRAPIVQEIFDKFDNGIKIKAIRDSLNERGIKTNLGSDFTYSKIGHMLRNSLYTGVYKYGDIIVPDGVPALIDKEQFERIQKRMKTYSKNHAKAKAHEEYLLTPKLFCGSCGKMMIGECGTSKDGTKHYYYKCSGAKRRKCTRTKGLKKDWIEKVAVLAALNSILKNSVIEDIADTVVALQEKEDPTIPALLRQLTDCESRISNVMKAIESGIITETTKDRMDQLESEKKRLTLAISDAQLKRPKFTKENVIQWINKFKTGNVDDKEFQRIVIDTFINSVYVYDDRIVFTFNFKKGTSSMTFEELNNDYCSVIKNAVPPLQKEPNLIFTKDHVRFCHFYGKSRGSV